MRYLVIAVFVALAVGVSTALAGSESSLGVRHGVIFACVETHGTHPTVGDIKLNHCRRGYKPLTWNIRGRTGPRGPAGAPGQQGPPGTAGTNGVANVFFDSDAQATTTAAVQTNFADFTGGSLIRDLTLPAGSYDIVATSSVRGATDGPAAPMLNTRVRCNLVNATAAVGLDTFYDDFFQPDEASPGFRQALQVGTLATLNVPTKIELRCYSIRPTTGTLPGQISSSKIVATQVATITAGH